MTSLETFENKIEDFGFRIYAQPSFLEGVARLIDFGSGLNEYNYSKTPEEADYKAILSDWEAVGSALFIAAKNFEREFKTVITNVQTE